MLLWAVFAEVEKSRKTGKQQNKCINRTSKAQVAASVDSAKASSTLVGAEVLQLGRATTTPEIWPI